MIRNLCTSLAWAAVCALAAPLALSADTLVLTHGGEGQKPLSRRAELRIPDSAIGAFDTVTLTSLGAQSLPGLLPLGWSPLASAEIVSGAPSLGGAELTFDVPRDELIATGQTLAAVRYQEDRDEWRVLDAAVNVSSDGKATIAIGGPGAYALVYPDSAPHLAEPAAPSSGAVLTGVADPCATSECPPLVAKNALELTPPAVLPTQRTVGTLSIEGSGEAKFPSGTAVQAYVDEELHLADGTRDVVAPFVTDLLLYRNLAGDTGVAEFHLAPSARASEVVLEVGYDHIRIVPYPERVDRGALIGPEGGRVPADDLVSVEIPAAATTEALKATATSIRDFRSFGTIAGYRIVGGLSLSLQWASAPAGEEVNLVELLKPARATFTVNDATLPSQLILVELLEGTPYGRVYRLASQITALEGGTRFSTKPIDRAVLPVDGIIREGTYLLLAPDAPIAFATGTVHVGENGPATSGARVLTPALGVVDITRLTGIFNVPVPAAAFTLVPRTPQTGDGTAYNHATAPAIDEVVNVGALSIVAQPPTVNLTLFAHDANGSLIEVSAAGASNVSLTTSIKASFSPGLDPSTVRDDSIVVIDDSDSSLMPGRATSQGSVAILWTLTPGTRLRPDARYTAVVSGGVRGANGTPLATSIAATFTTPATLNDPKVDPSKIRITMPDAEGRAQIIGAPGALETGWNAVAVRRGRDFTTRPQATADANRSFLIQLPAGTDSNDRITIADVLYLQIINDAGSVAAIIPLGPFTTEDNRGFVARPDVETRYTTIDNVTLSVPAGAFDTPTVVHVEPAQKTAIVDVPGFDEELVFHAGFKIDFEGIAKKRLDLAFPTPATLADGQSIYLGHYGQSARGPRIMIIDLLRRDGANLTTHHPEGSNARGVSSNSIINPNVARDMLLGIDRASLIIGTSFETNTYVAWATSYPPPVRLDLFVPPLDSVYYASFAMERDRILMPIPANGAFNIVGVDPESGLTVFDKPYTARAPGEPADAVEALLPITNERGPYPVFLSPGRSETLDIYAKSFIDESIRNIVAEYDGTTLRLENADRPLPAKTHVEAINLRTGELVSSDDFAAAAPMSLEAEVGDRLIVLIGDHDIDPATILTVVFSEPITKGTQEELRERFLLLVRDPAVPSSTFQPVAGELDFKDESGWRRISIIHHGSFQRGKQYRLVLTGNIADNEGLALAQTKDVTPPGDLHVDFTVRAPQGPVGTFEIPEGSVRDLTLRENIMLVTALEGGILAYDVSNPVVLGTTAPLAHIPPPVGSLGQSWAVAADPHDRFYATGVSPMYGVVRSYRIEDLYCSGSSCPPDLQRGNAIITWRPGINVGVPLSSMMIGGWPEATPRKLRVVTRDGDPETATFTELAGSSGTDVGNGFWKATIAVVAAGAAYDKQRITVTNVTRNYHWSVDVPKDGSASVTIIGQPLDKFEIVRNLSTIGVVTLFGHGIGVYDLNAVEANSRNLSDPDWKRMNDTIVVSDGNFGGAATCDRGAQALIGKLCEIGSLALTPESAVAVTAATTSILALDQNRGMVHLTLEAQTDAASAATFDRRGSIVFAEKLIVDGQGYRWFGHPRLNRLRTLYRTAAGVDPRGRYTSVDTFKRGENTYALVAGLDYGVLVVRLDAKLEAESLVDVIWIPAGAQSVRVSSAHQLAAVVDGKGRVLLINLGEVDESSKMEAEPECASIDCEWALFPTALAALTGASSGSAEIGSPDPRIVWTSPETAPDDPLVFGTLPPVFDPETGFLYAGSVLTKKMKVVSAIDPRVRFVGDTGDGTMQLLDTIVPLGIKPKPGTVQGPNGSRAAFRLEALLPGSLSESMGGEPLRMRIESETILGAVAPQTFEPLPRAHLRQNGSRPATGFQLIHDAPANTTDPDVKRLRYQRGWNRLVTPWIVAIADPRASEEYVWPTGADKEKEGCFSCDRPERLKLYEEPHVFELYTAGRIISARPETGAFSGPWSFLDDNSRRLHERVNTIIADTVRPPRVAVAGHNAPVIGGAVQETYYAHSGEMETSNIDLNAGGRAGVNVVMVRTYRSRTLGSTAFGAGWDSLLLQRIRPLPNGDAEYRDGIGNVWLFEKPTEGAGVTYKAPPGYYVRLHRTLEGWTITDSAWNQTKFDLFGRLTSAHDYLTDDKTSNGNTIRYRYDGEGQLSTIIDPYGRITKLSYWNEADYGTAGAAPGKIRTVTDWRDRKIDYEYENSALTTVRLPESKGDDKLGGDYTFTGSRRPRIVYTYATAAASVNDKLELGTNLESIKDPAENLVPGGLPRVRFAYHAGPDKRDRIDSETSSIPECTSGGCGVADFTYPADLQMEVHDLLGQARHYEVTDPSLYDKQAHLFKVIEKQVPVVAAAQSDLFTKVSVYRTRARALAGVAAVNSSTQD